MSQVSDAITEVPDLVEVRVPVGGRVMVLADLHLGPSPRASSQQVVAELARAVDAATGPGVVVVAGDLFDLIGHPEADVDAALRAHPRLRDALARYESGAERSLVVLPGTRDIRLAWDPQARRTVETQLGARVALAVDLVVDTGAGERRVRVEPGHQLDPAHAFADPRNPGESPLGHHVSRDLLPVAERAGATWLAGMDRLVDPGEVPGFIRSRLLYRRVAARAALLAVPFLVAAFAAVGWAVAGRPAHGAWYAGMVGALGLGGALLVMVGLGGVWWAWAVRRPVGILGQAVVTVGAGGAGGADHGLPSAMARNDAARHRGRALVGDGWTGYVSAHTQLPELTDLGGGFYANVGCGGEVVEARSGRLGLPDAYAVGRRLSWLELGAGPDLAVQLRWGRQALPSTTTLERLASRPVPGGDPRPAVVASWPDGVNWPEPDDQGIGRREHVRRLAAGLLALCGIVDLVSAITPPLLVNLRVITRVLPLAVPQVAAVLVVLSGISLLLLGRGVRRGQRHAWGLAVTILLATTVLHLVKGLDVAESMVAIGAGIYLLANRRHFRARIDESSARRSLLTVGVGALTAVAGGFIAVLTLGGDERPPFGDCVRAVAERMVGVTTIGLPTHVDHFLRPTLLATSVGLAVAAGWLLFRPVLHVDERPPEALEAARRIVAANGGDTLDYFALRHDKRFFFRGESLVAYAVVKGVALVSPDPIGPEAERREVWDAFRSFADDHGWPVAVMGAGDGWLPIYRASGMHDLYVGDEAVVDVRHFDLAGGRNKGLRQAVNRVARQGYRTEFHDPATIDPALEAQLRGLMTESRRGEVERGFSMTLGRIFDPDDTGLLVTVCFGPDDEPVAFCQYVPAPAIDGYSLDLMRRSEGEHPNGLTDFVVVETIRHLRERGQVGLGLNFAVMRAVLAGERGDSSLTRVQRWLLGRLGDAMQIESLWRFNAKFDPDWVPRYAVYDAPENLLTAALAVADAESFWELPVIGRFFRPSTEPVLLPAKAGRVSGPDPTDADGGITGPDRPTRLHVAPARAPAPGRTSRPGVGDGDVRRKRDREDDGGGEGDVPPAPTRAG